MTDFQDNADFTFMQQAVAQARAAALAGEVPVGAVVVKDGQVIGLGHNQCIAHADPAGHAEVVALRQAALHVQNYRLDGCTLYTTLEPCAMCAGAILHARLGRLVYGAADPKAGAAGSVLNLFANPRLNHRTQVQAGVLAAECAEPLQQFFHTLRERNRRDTWPLREDALRTPDACFANLPAYPWQPRYVSDLDSLAGLRLHYLDENPNQGDHSGNRGTHSPNGDLNQPTWLCLHGNPAWSYLYRKMIPVWTATGHRVVAPDLIGFGKSDKPKREAAHSFAFHRQYLLELVERLDLQNIILVVQDWGGLLGLTLPMHAPWRYRGLLIMNTTLATADAPLPQGFLAWRTLCADKPRYDIGRLFQRGNPHLSPAECAAYNAPFPDAGHRAATRAFPNMVPTLPEAPEAELSRQARAFWSQQWSGQARMAVGAADPVFGLEPMQALRQHIRGCPPPLVLPEGGHFVQEHGQRIAEWALLELT